ncbi:hypothetical protein BV25DRAFT_1831896 [Artomyces pyxidatus]|uniref:Uncharacterized protein n=1 Tax=Artomyces pyxidatus TaxID=48021 RepID=A0ACB8SJY6_9AGAM|nr:hypothetical protein BV25DRAFT_1831896 [Artomyces pyxidatus]
MVVFIYVAILSSCSPIHPLFFSQMPSTTLDVRTRAPIAKLPNELLRSIFLLTGRDLPSTLALTGVCSRWRAVALDAPRLWTTIRWDACAPAQRARVALQLSRAGCMPLRIRLSFPPRALDAEGLDALVGTLEHVLPRVECFAFQSEASAPASRVLSVLERTHMPLLEDLAIVADPECTVTNATYLPMSVPPLRRLRLVGVPLAWPSAGFAGLKSLALCFGREALKPEFLDLLDALRSCSETLEYLELQCVLQCTPIDEAFHHGEAEEALDEDQGSDTQDIPTVHANGSSVSQGTDSVSDNDDGYSDAASVSTATELSEDLYEAISVACAATLNPADAIVFPNLTELRLAFAYPIEGVALRACRRRAQQHRPAQPTLGS